MNIYLLVSSFVLCFSGFVIAFYGILAESMIELEYKIGVKKGVDLMTSEGAEYYAKKYDKWKAGRLFASSKSPASASVPLVPANKGRKIKI